MTRDGVVLLNSDEETGRSFRERSRKSKARKCGRVFLLLARAGLSWVVQDGQVEGGGELPVRDEWGRRAPRRWTSTGGTARDAGTCPARSRRASGFTDRSGEGSR